MIAAVSARDQLNHSMQAD
jgi:WD40 repeat protein